jgi:hypothetical protein
VTVQAALSATRATLTGSRAIPAVLSVAFLVLAFASSVVASRGLQARLHAFLPAARRLRGGDFSSASHVEGSDEFAASAEELNTCRPSFPPALSTVS